MDELETLFDELQKSFAGAPEGSQGEPAAQKPTGGADAGDGTPEAGQTLNLLKGFIEDSVQKALKKRKPEPEIDEEDEEDLDEDYEDEGEFDEEEEPMVKKAIGEGEDIRPYFHCGSCGTQNFVDGFDGDEVLKAVNRELRSMRKAIGSSGSDAKIMKRLAKIEKRQGIIAKALMNGATLSKGMTGPQAGAGQQNTHLGLLGSLMGDTNSGGGDGGFNVSNESDRVAKAIKGMTPRTMADAVNKAIDDGYCSEMDLSVVTSSPSLHQLAENENVIRAFEEYKAKGAK